MYACMCGCVYVTVYVGKCIWLRCKTLHLLYYDYVRFVTWFVNQDVASVLNGRYSAWSKRKNKCSVILGYTIHPHNKNSSAL